MKIVKSTIALRFVFVAFSNQDIADIMQSRLDMDGFERDKVWNGRTIRAIQDKFTELVTTGWEDKMLTAIELAPRQEELIADEPPLVGLNDNDPTEDESDVNMQRMQEGDTPQ